MKKFNEMTHEQINEMFDKMSDVDRKAFDEWLTDKILNDCWHGGPTQSVDYLIKCIAFCRETEPEAFDAMLKVAQLLKQQIELLSNVRPLH